MIDLEFARMRAILAQYNEADGFISEAADILAGSLSHYDRTVLRAMSLYASEVSDKAVAEERARVAKAIQERRQYWLHREGLEMPRPDPRYASILTGLNDAESAIGPSTKASQDATEPSGKSEDISNWTDEALRKSATHLYDIKPPTPAKASQDAIKPLETDWRKVPVTAGMLHQVIVDTFLVQSLFPAKQMIDMAGHIARLAKERTNDHR